MRRSNQLSIAAAVVASAALFITAYAQVGRGGSEWLTAGGDAQRTSWIRSDALISVASMSKPGFALQWKTALENANRRNYGIGQGVSAPGVTLFVPMSLVTGSANNVYAIDSDTGYLIWQRRFDAPLPAATDACPGGTTSAATRIVDVAPPALAASPERGGGGRAAQAYRSVIGQPGEGAPVEVRGGGAGRGGSAPPAGGRGPGAAPNAAGSSPAVAPPPGAPPAAGQRAGAPAPGRGAGQGGGFGRGAGEPIPGAPPEQVGGGGGLGRPSGVVYAISSDGVLHVMGLQSGKDLQTPAPFLPANSRWSDPIAVGTTLYTSTSGGCGGAPNAVWAIDLASESKPVASWKSDGPIVGELAFTTDGTLVAVTSSTIVTLDAKTLQVKNSTKAPGSEFVTGATIFKHGSNELIAVALKNGRLFLGGLNRDSGSDSVVAAGSLATWQESGPSGTRWILVPARDSVAALRVTEPSAPPSTPRGWTASNLTSPATPIVVNGVAFVLERGTTAVLHAYEGTTGKELWSSKQTMTSAAAPGSFWSAFGQVYVGTADGTLYAFGFADDRR
jgi:outer membrane protein assembly factor BamB